MDDPVTLTCTNSMHEMYIDEYRATVFFMCLNNSGTPNVKRLGGRVRTINGQQRRGARATGGGNGIPTFIPSSSQPFGPSF